MKYKSKNTYSTTRAVNKALAFQLVGRPLLLSALFLAILIVIFVSIDMYVYKDMPPETFISLKYKDSPGAYIASENYVFYRGYYKKDFDFQRVFYIDETGKYNEYSIRFFQENRVIIESNDTDFSMYIYIKPHNGSLVLSAVTPNNIQVKIYDDNSTWESLSAYPDTFYNYANSDVDSYFETTTWFRVYPDSLNDFTVYIEVDGAFIGAFNKVFFETYFEGTVDEQIKS